MDGAALVAKVFDAFDRSADGYLDKDELFDSDRRKQPDRAMTGCCSSI